MAKLKNKIGKWLSLFLTVCILAAALPMEALAANEIDFEVYYTCGGYIRVNRFTGILRNSDGLSGDLVIPESVEGVRVTAIGDRAFYGCEGLTSVTVPSSVQSIGDQAFTSCLALKSVTLGEGVTSLGKNAFQYCYALTDVSLPSTLKAIEDYTFFKCLALRSVTVPSNVERIGSYAFSDSTKLTSVSLPSSLTSLGTYCFSGCTALKNINLPAKLSSIPTALFNGCTSLEKLVVPDGVQRVYELAFRGCSGLKSLSLPDSITRMSGSAFDGCGNVTFYVNAGSYAQAFASANGIPFVLGELSTDPGPEDELGNYPATPFTDDKNHWARKYIEWAYAFKYFNGVSDTKFAPDAPMNRAMLVTVLYNMEGSPAAGTSSFSDVPEKAYYAKAVAWAENAKVVSGMGNGKFQPTRNISREQLATMLYNYAQYKKADVSKRGDLSQFKDNSEIGNYAGTAMSWAVGSGIVSGMSSTTLSPKGNATRAQAAVMLQKFQYLLK